MFNLTSERKKYLVEKAHLTKWLIFWLSMHPAITDSERARLKDMTYFMSCLFDRIKDIESED